MRILIAGADRTEARRLAEGLRGDGHSAESVASGQESLRQVGRDPELDAVIVAGAPTDMSAVELTGALRRGHPTIPILIVADLRGEEVVAALDAGADCQVGAASEPAQISARLRAIARRTNQAPYRVRCGEVVIDLPSRSVWRGGEAVTLTPREFELLELLARQCDRAVPRSQLHERIWGDAAALNSMNVVDVYVSRLRRKLAPNGAEGGIIRTVPGTGYMLLSDRSLDRCQLKEGVSA